MAKGDLQSAREWAAGAVFDPEAWNPNRQWVFLSLVWLYLVQHEHTEALAALRRFRALLERPGDIATTIEFLALYAIALHQAGDREQARTVMACLLALTEPEGHLLVYLEKGDLMRLVLQDILAAARTQEVALPPASIAFVSKLLGLFEQKAQNVEHRAQTPDALVLRSALERSNALLEPLTQRELEVLHLLATGAPNQAIADRLVISLATVKKHVSNLLGKLQAETRTQAIARAREWSVLE